MYNEFDSPENINYTIKDCDTRLDPPRSTFVTFFLK